MEELRGRVNVNMWSTRTHVFIGGQIGSNQVSMEAWETQNGPDWEEANDQFHCSESMSQGNPSNPGERSEPGESFIKIKREIGELTKSFFGSKIEQLKKCF